MRNGCLLLLAVGLLSSAARAQHAQCNDLSWLAQEVPDASLMIGIIQALGLMPNGFPPGTTAFFPSNEATSKLPAVLDLPFTVDTIISAAAALGPEMTRRLNSAVLYHIVPVGAFQASALAEWHYLPTALPDTSIVFGESVPGSYVAEDVNGQQADVLQGPLGSLRSVCGVAIYVIDKVLLPGASLGDLPRVPAAAANLALGGLVQEAPSDRSAVVAPAPAPEPAA